MNTTQIRTRQENEIKVVNALYESMPIGVEIPTGANTIAKHIGISHAQVATIAYDLERIGVISRREVWPGGGGKRVLWTLNMSKEDALSAVIDFQSNSVDTRSLKARILEAIKTKGKYNSALEILNDIRQPNENLDLHNITHCMYSLRTQGRITFKTKGGGSGKLRMSNDRVPVGITYREPKSRKVIHNSSPAPIAEVETVVPESVEPVTPAIMDYGVEGHGFPLIKALVNRRITLETAASMAEAAGEDDLALKLLEKAQADESAFNQEVIALWEAYSNCLTK